MKYLLLISLVFGIVGCSHNKKMVNALEPNTINSVLYSNQQVSSFFKEVMVRNSLKAPSDRTQQLNRVIEPFGFKYNYAASFYDFYELPISNYVVNNEVVTLERFLILLCEDDCLIFVDDENKLIRFDLRTINKPVFKPSFVAHNQEFDKTELVEESIVVASPYLNIVKPINSNIDNNKTPLIEGDDKNVIQSERVSLILGANNENIKELNDEVISISKGESLFSCFQKVADYLHVELINELGNKKWILDSYIDSDITFNNSDDAILSLVEVVNNNLSDNQYSFLLNLKLNNSSQLVISYE